MNKIWDPSKLSEEDIKFYFKKAHLFFTSVYHEFDNGLLTHPSEFKLNTGNNS